MTQDNDILLVLDWFNREQVKKLGENADKSHWRELEITDLLNMLMKEHQELDHAIHHKTTEDAIRKCADVANVAMMLADKIKRQ